MANNVYIGSRYVPIFDGAWSASKVYEPLTIVEYGNSSYTSKKQVPAGTLPTNTDYWALTGNYNGQIANLDGRLTTAESDIDNLETDVAKRSFNDANRRYVLIGDSLGTGTYTGTPGHGWCHFFKDALGLTEGVNVFTTAVDGKGWTTSGTNFLTMAQGLTVSDPDTITDVIVLGGLNDYASDFMTVWGAANTLYNYLHNRFKNAKIKFGALGRSRDNATVNNGMENAVIPAIKNCNAIYIAGSDEFAYDYWRYVDTWHWNENYSQVFSLLLAANKGLKVNVDRNSMTPDFVPDADFSTANSPIVTMYKRGNQVCAAATSGKLFQYSTDKTFPAGTGISITLGTMRSYISGNGMSLVPVKGFIGFSAPVADFHPFAGYLSFNAGTNGYSTVKLNIPGVFAGDTAFVSRTVHNFVIDVPAFEVNDMFA